MSEQKKYWGIQAAFAGAAVVMVGGFYLATMSDASTADRMPGNLLFQFDGVPRKCEDFSPATLNRLLADAPLVKMTGVKVLEITERRDITATPNHDRAGAKLSCSLSVLLSSGSFLTAAAWVKDVNRTPYLFVNLFPNAFNE